MDRVFFLQFSFLFFFFFLVFVFVSRKEIALEFICLQCGNNLFWKYLRLLKNSKEIVVNCCSSRSASNIMLTNKIVLCLASDNVCLIGPRCSAMASHVQFLIRFFGFHFFFFFHFSFFFSLLSYFFTYFVSRYVRLTKESVAKNDFSPSSSGIKPNQIRQWYWWMFAWHTPEVAWDQ